MELKQLSQLATHLTRSGNVATSHYVTEHVVSLLVFCHLAKCNKSLVMTIHDYTEVILCRVDSDNKLVSCNTIILHRHSIEPVQLVWFWLDHFFGDHYKYI